MKRLFPFVLAALLAGCSTLPRFDLDAVLDRALPATYRGNAHVEHKNPYFDFTIDAGNLRRGEGGRWEYDWLRYKRRGRVSDGVIILGSAADATLR